MDQQAEYPEEPLYEPEEELEYGDDSIVAPPLESAFGKYLREYRLLNSLLMSLLLTIIFLIIMWKMYVIIKEGGEGDAEFEGGAPAAAQKKQEKQKVVKLMQRQQKTKTTQQTFRTTAISDITLPDFNELDVKDLAPVVNASAPSTGNVGMSNDAMKSALKGIGLSLPKTMQQRCDPQKRIARLRSGTESRIRLKR